MVQVQSFVISMVDCWFELTIPVMYWCVYFYVQPYVAGLCHVIPFGFRLHARTPYAKKIVLRMVMGPALLMSFTTVEKCFHHHNRSIVDSASFNTIAKIALKRKRLRNI